jgi:hypothetical protein
MAREDALPPRTGNRTRYKYVVELILDTDTVFGMFGSQPTHAGMRAILMMNSYLHSDQKSLIRTIGALTWQAGL